MTETFPEAARAFLEFPQILRDHNFAIAGDQMLTFMTAAPLLAPLNLRRLHRAAHATLAPPPGRHAEFDALFQNYFTGGESVVAARSLPERDAPVSEGLGAQQAMAELRKLSESGKSTTQSEALGIRRLRGLSGKLLGRTLRQRLPHRLRLRQQRMPHGKRLDLRRSLSSLVANDGDLVALARSGRKSVPRRIVLLIDISGSMKAETDDYLDLAYELTREFRDTETFAFGTRLTRLTQALRVKSRETALSRASDLVADWDGGTRIGAALETFLANPRLSGLAHGAIVVVISDGLERGDHARMTEAVRRLDRRARHLLWLSPLAGDARYRPETAAVKAILPIVGRIRDGSTSEMVIHSLLSLPGLLFGPRMTNERH